MLKKLKEFFKNFFKQKENKNNDDSQDPPDTMYPLW